MNNSRGKFLNSILLAGLLAGISAISLFSITEVSAQSIPSYISSAVNSQARVEADKERDARRKPAQILALSGVKPGDKVVEFAGFGQYYTNILTEIVGDSGQVHMFDLPYTGDRAGENSAKFTAAHSNMSYHLVNYNIMDMPQNVDVVFNVLYYHDLPLNNIDTAALNKKIYAGLKPGGVFLIVDHNAEAGSGTRDTKALHRIDPAVIKAEVVAAGFELVEESSLLANADDDHSKMVYRMDGRDTTDQIVLKFRKPK